LNQIYDHPDDYDLEHRADDDDIGFYCVLVHRLAPFSVIELGCGTGRITVPLAQAAVRDNFIIIFNIIGLDSGAEMLDKAREHLAKAPSEARQRVKFVEGDMRSWRAISPAELIVVPCSSISHVLSLDDQLQLWRTAFDNLAEDGRFVVEVQMPNLAAFADSFSSPPRVSTEVDLDVTDPRTKSRLLRHKSTSYASDDQKASIRFVYERFEKTISVERYIDDFASHVYFPRELQLLFMHTGFEIEAAYGDYHFRPLEPASQLIIMIGRKPGSLAKKLRTSGVE
jgi:SAM-dependent methyltransferase